MRKITASLLLIGLSIGIQGCIFKDLKKELETFEDNYAITGQVVDHAQEKGPIIVVLVSEVNDQRAIRQIVFTEPTGEFSFLVPAGDYRLAAFADANSNMIYDRGEAAGFFGAPDRIRVPPENGTSSASRDVRNLTIRLTSSAKMFRVFPELAHSSMAVAQSLVRLGSIAQLDDPRFSQENGSLGYWKPATFLQDLGFGIYFMEPYHPQKIPVLFVHGALGTPSGFAPLVEAMDRDKFQPWFLYYPSGVRLGEVVDALTAVVERLHANYGFEAMAVTAHSMGGLVSRGFIKQYAQTKDPAAIPLLVSISTPWAGSKMAAKGAVQAPVAVPCWHDMDPGSDFIRGLFATPLPANVRHHLFFGFKGVCSMFMDNNDGTVELESQLDYRAQREAWTTIGLNEDHGSILESRELIAEYTRILNRFADTQAR